MRLHKIEKKAYHQRGGACLQGKEWYSIAILQYCSLQPKLPIIGNYKTWIANIFWRGSSLLAADPVGREGETWQQGDSQLCCSPVLMSGRCIVWKSWQEATAQVWAHRPTPPPPPHSSTSPQGLKLSPPVPLSFKLPNISWQRVFLNRDPNPGKRSHLPSLTSGHL